MQKPCEHLARTSSQRRGSCVFLFRLGTRNLRLPTAASNHRRCTHTNTLAQTHNVSHDSLTLLFFFSLPPLLHPHSQTGCNVQSTHTQTRHGTATRLSSFPESTAAAAKLVTAAASSFSHRGENLGPSAGVGWVFTAARKATRQGGL